MVSFPEWTTNPIPGVSLSAGGLLALADLSTVAQRTAITGGSSWLDSLLLAPGLHYQQAADELAKWSGSSATAVVDAGTGPGPGASVTRPTTFRINNAATILYLQKIARPGQTVTLDVGTIPAIRQRLRIRRSESGLHATVWAVDDLPDLGWLSHVLYLISPLLTIAAIVLVILFQDWWTLASLLALMLSRILNIYIIKQRSKPRLLPSLPFPFHPFHPPSSPSPSPNHHHKPNPITSLLISLGSDSPSHPSTSSIRLRGLSEDLYAITATAWLRSKTHVEGYLEATAKVLVYMVAAFSGNMTQVGAMIMMVLLLATAGLLALSNANAKMFRVNGRVVVGERERVFLGEEGSDGARKGKGMGMAGGGGGEIPQRQRRRTGGLGQGVYPAANGGGGVVGYGNGNGNVIDAWPSTSDTEGRGYAASDNNWAEKGQAGGGDYGGM